MFATPRKPHCPALALLLATLVTAGAAAATPETVVWSARVENDAGPLDGTVSLTLTLFDAETGGSAVHEETIASAVVVDGELVHELGASAGNPLDDAVLERPALYLQVAMNGETLSPRLPIRSVPYALRAEQCNTLQGLSADDVATDAELATALQGFSVPFSSITGVPAGLADGELTAAAGGGLSVSGNTIGIGTSAVTAGMIASSAVTSAKIAADAVTASTIAANAVGSSEVADSSITSADIATGTITADDIADGAITRTDVLGQDVYALPTACGGGLSLSASCRTLACSTNGSSLNFLNCSGSCSSPAPLTCNGTDVGELVR